MDSDGFSHVREIWQQSKRLWQPPILNERLCGAVYFDEDLPERFGQCGSISFRAVSRLLQLYSTESLHLVDVL